jgi:hypothetical protein
MKMLCLLCLIFLVACSKVDETSPTILIVSPQQNDVFASGQTITIKATIMDNHSIHMVHTIVTDNSGGHWVHSEEHTDGKNYNVNKTFPALSGKTYTIHIDATDHNENITEKEITVSVN